MKTLSILIPTVERHEKYLKFLFMELQKQISPYENEIEILIDGRESETTGAKRNNLLEKATGEYLAFVDADDSISQDYIDHLIEVVNSGCDCGSLKGAYSVDGKFDGIFEHSLKYKEWKTTDKEIKYERYPNHLNCIKSSIAKQFKFPDKHHGEDFDWSTQVHESGLLKTEFYIPDVIYFYRKVND